MHVDEFLKPYLLKAVEIKKIDLRNCYTQYTPNRLLTDIFTSNGILDYKMTNSPHFEIFSLYKKYGEKWLRENYQDTKYYKMFQTMDKYGKLPKKIKKLYESMKKGYLHGKYKDKYIVLLHKPFAKTRYWHDIDNHSPEVFSGHHRIGALLALEKYVVPVVFAKDTQPGTHYSYGKIHRACKRYGVV